MAVTLVAGCSSGSTQPQADAGAERIECALRGAVQFTSDCLVERSISDGARILVVRHPDGSFRRFEQVNDGRGLLVADGADPLLIQISGQQIDVAVGQDRYRFPAKVVGAGGK